MTLSGDLVIMLKRAATRTVPLPAFDRPGIPAQPDRKAPD